MEYVEASLLDVRPAIDVNLKNKMVGLVTTYKQSNKL